MSNLQALWEVLAQIPDPRHASGRRYPFHAVLNLVCAALVCGYDNPNQMAHWGHAQSPAFLRDLGFARGSAPRKSQLYARLGQRAVEKLEQVLGACTERVLQALSGEAELEGVALDGKTLRGSQKQGASAECGQSSTGSDPVSSRGGGSSTGLVQRIKQESTIGCAEDQTPLVHTSAG